MSKTASLEKEIAELKEEVSALKESLKLHGMLQNAHACHACHHHCYCWHTCMCFKPWPVTYYPNQITWGTNTSTPAITYYTTTTGSN